MLSSAQHCFPNGIIVILKWYLSFLKKQLNSYFTICTIINSMGLYHRIKVRLWSKLNTSIWPLQKDTEPIVYWLGLAFLDDAQCALARLIAL